MGLAAVSRNAATPSGCYVELDGRTVRVEGLPGDMADQQGYAGQTLILVGRLGLRPVGRSWGAVPPEVLAVESFRRA